MSEDAFIKSSIPMTETAFYILLSLTKTRHGYGIIKYVDELTKGRIRLGSGTVYGTVQKMQKSGVITASEQDGKTVYSITERGRSLLSAEVARIKQLYKDTIQQEGELE